MRRDPRGYLFGYWLGDGCASAGNRRTVRLLANEFDLRAVEEALVEFGRYPNFHPVREGAKVWIYSCSWFWEILNYYKVSDYQLTSLTKRIPDCLFSEPIEVRWEVLSGLIDSDGSVYVSAGGVRSLMEYVRVGYGSHSPGLVLDVKRLIGSLGMSCGLRGNGRGIIMHRGSLKKLRFGVVLQEKKQAVLDSLYSPSLEEAQP